MGRSSKLLKAASQRRASWRAPREASRGSSPGRDFRASGAEGDSGLGRGLRLKRATASVSWWTGLRAPRLGAVVLLGALLASCVSAPRKGDLLFIAAASGGGMDGAIASATGAGNAQAFVHVAIIDQAPDGSLWAIEATPSRGVSRHPLDTLIADNRLPDGTLPYMECRRLKPHFSADAAISLATSRLGQPYDFYYLQDNAAAYCSELVYDSYLLPDGTHIFDTVPMNFKADDGTFPPFWVDLFARLGRPIPQDAPGTNPQQLSEQPIFTRTRIALPQRR